MTVLPRRIFAGMNQHYRMYSFEYFLRAQAQAGIETFEMWMGSPHFRLGPDGFGDCAGIRRKVREHGLEIVSATAPSMQRQYQCAAPAGEAFESSLKYFSNGIRAAAQLGCGLMTVNSGWGLADEPEGESWKRSREMIFRLCRVAESEGVVLALESLRLDESEIVDSLPAAVKMFGEIGHPALGAMIDTIAMGAAGETLDDWFDAFGEDVLHMHFVDGDPYVHAIWGDGNYPLGKMLETLGKRGYRGYLVQEIADERYFADPAGADMSNMRVLGGFGSGPVYAEKREHKVLR